MTDTEVAAILADIDKAMPRVDGGVAYDLYAHLRRLREALGLPENPGYPGTTASAPTRRRPPTPH